MKIWQVWGIYFGLLATAAAFLALFVRASHAKWVLSTLIALQVVFVFIIVFGDIGFDHRGRYGLDFGDFVQLVWLYGAALTFGVVVATKFQKHWWTLAQVLLLLGGVLLS